MKSKEKIEQLKQALEQELESLPAKNAFGDSNEKDRELLKIQIFDLKAVLSGTNIDEVVDGELKLWLQGNPGALIGIDYGVE